MLKIAVRGGNSMMMIVMVVMMVMMVMWAVMMSVDGDGEKFCGDGDDV